MEVRWRVMRRMNNRFWPAPFRTILQDINKMVCPKKSKENKGV
jgi:hypothetical protein